MARREADNATALRSSATNHALPSWVIDGTSFGHYATPSYTMPPSPTGHRAPATWLPVVFLQAPSAKVKAPAYSHVPLPGLFGAFPGADTASSSRLGLSRLSSNSR
jgi:hypothetical protein